MPAGKTAVQFVCDACASTASGLNLIDGKKAEENVSRVNGQLITPGKRHTLDYYVTKDRIRATVDEKEFVDWTDLQRVSMPPIFKDPAEKGITLFVWETVFEIHELTLIPTSGHGHRVR